MSKRERPIKVYVKVRGPFDVPMPNGNEIRPLAEAFQLASQMAFDTAEECMKGMRMVSEEFE